MRRLLLHCCCAPCTSGVLWQLEDYDVTCFYYNPNISPKSEHDFRADELKRYLDIMKKDLIVGAYDNEKYVEKIMGLEQEKEGGKRCFLCFELRLRETAKLAKEKGFDLFTTTLSVSPFKNANVLNEIGEKISKEIGIEYLPANFKKNNGYLKSIENSKKYNLYRQNYCGCVYSKRDEK